MNIADYIGPETFEAIRALALGLLLFIVSSAALVLRKTVERGVEAYVKYIEGSAKEKDSQAHLASQKCFAYRLEKLTTRAVMDLEQTFVRKMKREKRWDKKAARIARDTAVEVMEKHAGPAGLAEMMACSGLDIEGLRDVFRTSVEAEVASKGSTDARSPIVSRGKGTDALDFDGSEDHTPVDGRLPPLP